MSSKQISVTNRKTGFGKKGYMHKEESKVYIHVDYDGKTYFVYAKTLNDILSGAKKGTSILGY